MSTERNINLFYLYRFFWMGLYFLSILFVFYEARGLSFFEITTLGVVWSAFAFLLEVPTGILSDRWSRKYTLVLSSLFSIIMCLVFIYSQNYLLFVIATLFYALRDTFYSGTVNSLLYDSLQELGREKEFEKILGRSNFFHAFSLVIASIIGSYLIALGFSIPFVVSGIFMLLTFLVALLFVEPARVSDPGETSLVSHIKSSMKFMITNGAIRFYVIYLIFLTISLELVVEHDQFYLIALPWLALQLTGNAFAMGTVLAMAGIPRAAFMLVGGALTDRFSPRMVMLVSNIVRGVLVAVLTVLILTEIILFRLR